MIKYLRNISIALLLIVYHSMFAGNGLLFNVSATGTHAKVNITLCLNGKGPLSCQNYNVSAIKLNISTTPANHIYPFAGIKINTPGYTVANVGTDCTPFNTGYCLFSTGNTAHKQITIQNNNTHALSLSPATLPPATLNTAYNQTLIASGEIGPYIYTVSSSSLPPGLSLTSSGTNAGLISGTPTSNGIYPFTITAADTNSSDSGSKNYTIVVSGSLTLNPSSLPAGQRGTAYNQTITASSGVGPYTFTVASGTLPPGLTLSSGGAITGTPTNMGTYHFTIMATDTNSADTGSQSYSLVINASFAYVTNPHNNTVSLCQVNHTSGALSGCTSTGSGFGSPDYLSLSPDNSVPRHAYIANFLNSNIILCTADSITGQLSSCAQTGPSFLDARVIILNSAMTFAYISGDGGSGNVTQCSIDSTTGALSNCVFTGSGFLASSGMALNPAGTIMYVTSSNFSTLSYVSRCAVDPVSGALTNCVTTGSGFSVPARITLNTTGTFAYITNQGTSNITLCEIDQTNGDLNNCTTTGTGGVFSQFGNLAMNISDTLAYVPNSSTNIVSLCTVNVDGTLSGCANSGGTGFNFPQGITLG